MKKLILAAVIASAPIAATASSNTAGCGLGTAVIFKNPNSWIEHYLAGVTNHFPWAFTNSQSSGITSGTLGCESAGGPLASGVDYFIEENIDLIAMESATGGGETLDALAELIGISETDKHTFNLVLHSNFDILFPDEHTSSGHLYDSIVSVMAQNSRLEKYIG